VVALIDQAVEELIDQEVEEELIDQVVEEVEAILLIKIIMAEEEVSEEPVMD
jgi:hypothetical protein